MTIMSANLLFSDKQAITASAASTNILDLGAYGTPYGHAAALVRDLGRGEPIPFLIQVTTTFATLTSLTIALEKDDNSSFSSAATVITTPAIAAATLVAGYQVPIQVLPKDIDERYIRFYYTVGGSNATAGNITAAITMGNQDA